MTTPNTVRLRVATYNIRHGAPQGRGKRRLHPFFDHRRLARAVRELHADVVALQEVDFNAGRSWRRDQSAVACSLVDMTRLPAPATPLDDGGLYGNALLHRGRLLHSELVRLHSTGEQRVGVIARIEHGPLELTVVGTHLQNPSKRRPGEARRQLEELLGALSAWPEPWVVLGDMNLGPTDVPEVFAAHGIVAAETPPTFPTRNPRERIDWVGVRGGSIGAVSVPDLRASDHRPIVADVSFAVAPPREATTTHSARVASKDGSPVHEARL